MRRYVTNPDAPKAIYKGVTVVYNLYNNNWTFTLRGRDKISSTLQLAMEAIDKPEPKNKKPFDQFKAYYRDGSYGNDYEIVTVTSLAAKGTGYGGLEAWIRHETPKTGWRKKGDRSKVTIDKLFAVNVENDKLLTQLRDVEKEQSKLSKMEDDLRQTMQQTHIRKTDYDE